MVKISLRDKEFAHVPDCKEACDRPTYFQFDREDLTHDIIILPNTVWLKHQGTTTVSK